MANDHVDSFSKTEAPSTQTATPQVAPERKAVDNETRAAEVEQRREFAAGGGGDENPAAKDPGGGAAAAIERATQRVRATDRPSPFGVAQFPPLPQP
jgi:hypothetical protein